MILTLYRDLRQASCFLTHTELRSDISGLQNSDSIKTSFLAATAFITAAQTRPCCREMISSRSVSRLSTYRVRERGGGYIRVTCRLAMLHIEDNFTHHYVIILWFNYLLSRENNLSCFIINQSSKSITYLIILLYIVLWFYTLL